MNRDVLGRDWYREADAYARDAEARWRAQQTPEFLAAFDQPPTVCVLRVSVPQVDGHGSSSTGVYPVGTTLRVYDRSPYTHKDAKTGERLLARSTRRSAEPRGVRTR